MRKMIWLLALLCCAATAAIAVGPNAGGVLWVHNTGKAFTAGPVFDPDPVNCPTGINTEMPLWDGVTPAAAVSVYWKVYAAFPAGSSPRLKSVAWGTQFPEAATSPASYVSVTNGDRVPPETSSTVFFIGGAGFPNVSGGVIGQSFPPGARTTLVTPLFMFWGWGYGTDPSTPTWCLVPKTGDDNFGDDNIPAHTDRIAGYGCLGFGIAGTVPCPTPTLGGCCNLTTGACVLSLPLDCVGSDVVWQWQACSPNPCAQPSGACCNAAAGMPSCVVTTEADCAAYLPVRVWRGAATVCNTTTCPVPPPTGACCNTAVGMPACTITTQAACISPLVWLGADISCNTTNCPVPPPMGACCNTAVGMPDCTITTQAACISPLVWLGADIPCDATTCPVPIGSCCFPDGTCAVWTEAQCAAGPTDLTQIADRRLTKAARRVPGIWTLGGTCDPNLCVQPPVTGACCDVLTGACTITTAAACQFSWLGADVPCNTITCPVPVIPTGACCNVLTGDCTITTAAACQFSWLGADVPCNTITCPVPVIPTGACCDVLTGGCTITTVDACQFSWLGAGIPCDAVTCPPPVVPAGACCLSDGTCQDMPAAVCASNGGTWRGLGSACATTADCAQPDGACCLPNGSCQPLTAAACVAAGGQWHGYLSNCATTVCVQPAGACCAPNGDCTVTLQAACAGTWTMFGTCVPNVCGLPTGACCAPNGDCTVTLQAACAGTWTMFGTCVPNMCGLPTGACCAPNGDCTVTLQTACTGTWTMFGTCVPNVCAPPTGACCNTAVGMPACTITTQADCISPLVWLGADIPCNATTCALPAPSTGSCCTRGGNCTVTTQADCAVTSTWTPDGVCVPNTCQVPGTGSCCFRNSYCMIFTPARCTALRGTWVGDAACAPSANPRCLVLPSKGGDPIPDQSAPAEQKDSWGQIKNRYR